MSFDNTDLLKRYGKGRLSKGLVFQRIFDAKKPGDWSLVKQRKKKEDKKSDAEEEKHAAGNIKVSAVLNKTGDWSGNFSYFIRGGEGKSRADEVYNKVSPNIVSMYGKNRPPLVKFFKDYFTLDGVNCNFNTKAKRKINGKSMSPGQQKPYTWEAHHMIPGDVFTQMRAGVSGSQPIFNARQLRLLLMSDYNVNNGHNMIALPTNRMDFYQPVHDLIQHPSNHDTYTSRVVREMKKIAKSLNKLTRDLSKPHPDVVVKIAQKLKILEDQLWKLLIRIGKASIAGVVVRKKVKLDKEDQKLLKYQTEGGDTQYPMAALG